MSPPHKRWGHVGLPREGHGAMARAWRFADVTTCRAVSNPAWCKIFREISCFSPLSLGTLLRCCVLGHDTSPSNASFDSGENEYLVGQRCTLSSMRQNGYRTVCSPGNGNDTRMSRSSDQGVKCKVR